MDKFYQQLLTYANGAVIRLTAHNVNTKMVKNRTTTEITTVYHFKSDSNVTETVTNLLERTSKVVKLTHIKIVRTIAHNKISAQLVFLGDDETVLKSDINESLISVSDEEVLKVFCIAKQIENSLLIGDKF